MSCMFSECNSLKTVDISNFNYKNVTRNYGMFSGCISLINII
jgi:surface protein